MEKQNDIKFVLSQLLKNIMRLLKKEFSSWAGMYRILLFIIILVSFLCAAFLITVNVLRNTGFKVITANGTTISINPNTKIQQFLIDPRQANATKIELKKGDEVRINVSGSIHIALGRIFQALQYQYKIKDSLELATGERGLIKFTEDQLKKSFVAYPWNGPSGIDTNLICDEKVKKSIFLSLKHRVMPDAQVGQLIAFVSETRDQFTFNASDTGNIIRFNEESIEFKVKKRGYLWFIVNDDYYKNHIKNSCLLNQVTLQDNMGFFNATITID